MEENKTTKEKKEITSDYLNEEIEVEFMKDDGKYKHDIPVILNGTAILVPRGKKVKIKRKYALIIQGSMAEASRAIAKAEALASE